MWFLNWRVVENLGPVHTYPDIFESATFFPDTATVHTYPANSTANPEKNKSALQSGKKYIRNETDNVWTGPEWKKKNKSALNPITCGRVNPDNFLSDDVKSVSNLSPNNKPIWRHNVEGEQSKFPATISLYGACSEAILMQRSLRY